MSVTLQALPAGQRLTTVAIRRRARRGRLYGSDRVWAIAFALPYVVIFFAFVLYRLSTGCGWAAIRRYIASSLTIRAI